MAGEMQAEGIEDLKSLRLAEATAQDIQLELIRRHQYNAFDGEKVAAKLWEHRDLWDAVMMDRLAISSPGRLPSMGLIKLRDLPDNLWNVDTLYSLAASKGAGERLAEIFNMEIGAAWSACTPTRKMSTAHWAAAAKSAPSSRSGGIDP